jgi:hypothetical protein
MESLDKDLELLSSVGASELGSSLLQLITGSKAESHTRFASELEGLLRLIRTEIFMKARKRDIIKVTIDWLNIGTDIDEERISWLGELANRGFKVRVLGQYRPTPELKEQMTLYYRILSNLGIETDYRIRRSERNTYQFIGLQRLGIVLVVAERPLATTWIPKRTSPLLVKHAFESFDADFENGEPIIFDNKIR